MDACLNPAGTFRAYGISGHVNWSDLEPSPGVFDFTTADDLIQATTNAGMKYYLRVLAGVRIPSWYAGLGGAGETLFVSGGTSTGAGPQQVPWTAFAQTRFRLLVDALAARYANNPTVELVTVIMVGAGGEVNLDDAADWASVGYTDALYAQAVNDQLDYLAAKFPRQTITLSTDNPFASGTHVFDRSRPVIAPSVVSGTVNTGSAGPGKTITTDNPFFDPVNDPGLSITDTAGLIPAGAVIVSVTDPQTAVISAAVTGNSTTDQFLVGAVTTTANGTTTNNSKNISHTAAVFTGMAGMLITDTAGKIQSETLVQSVGGGGTTAVVSRNCTGATTGNQFVFHLRTPAAHLFTCSATTGFVDPTTAHVVANARMAVQQNGLKLSYVLAGANSPPPGGTLIEQGAATARNAFRTNVYLSTTAGRGGYQMGDDHGTGTAPTYTNRDSKRTVQQKDFDAGINDGVDYIEVYAIDVANPNYAATLTNLSAARKTTP